MFIMHVETYSFNKYLIPSGHAKNQDVASWRATLSAMLYIPSGIVFLLLSSLPPSPTSFCPSFLFCSCYCCLKS